MTEREKERERGDHSVFFSFSTTAIALLLSASTGSPIGLEHTSNLIEEQ